MLSQTVPAGRVTRMCHDKANRLLETSYPDTTPAADRNKPRTQGGYDDDHQLPGTSRGAMEFARESALQLAEHPAVRLNASR